MKKIVTIIGARPQFVKAAVVSRSLAALEVEEVVVHTGQHYDYNMSEVFFEEMEIPHPSYNLGVNGMHHGEMTGKMLEGIEKVLLDERPGMVLVYGDTNSTLAGALAAKKLHIPVAHVEAGLRSFNMAMPEEINRILTDRISDLLFCPTDTAVQNLSNEGKQLGEVIKTGDVMYDAALFYKEKASKLAEELPKSPFVLCTIHRQENTDDLDRLRSIIEGLNRIHAHTRVVFPIHPRTAKIIEHEGIELKVDTIAPVGYLQMVRLLQHCSMVMTDSGGLQKEAFFFEKYCLTVRDETEWVELVKHGYNFLVAADADALYQQFEACIDKTAHFEEQLYGDGHSGDAIAAKVLQCLNQA